MEKRNGQFDDVLSFIKFIGVLIVIGLVAIAIPDGTAKVIALTVGTPFLILGGLVWVALRAQQRASSTQKPPNDGPRPPDEGK